MDPNVQNPLIQKETISPGHTFVQFLPGARVSIRMHDYFKPNTNEKSFLQGQIPLSNKEM